MKRILIIISIIVFSSSALTCPSAPPIISHPDATFSQEKFVVHTVYDDYGIAVKSVYHLIEQGNALEKMKSFLFYDHAKQCWKYDEAEASWLLLNAPKKNRSEYLAKTLELMKLEEELKQQEKIEKEGVNFFGSVTPYFLRPSYLNLKSQIEALEFRHLPLKPNGQKKDGTEYLGDLGSFVDQAECLKPPNHDPKKNVTVPLNHASLKKVAEADSTAINSQPALIYTTTGVVVFDDDKPDSTSDSSLGGNGRMHVFSRVPPANKDKPNEKVKYDVELPKIKFKYESKNGKHSQGSLVAKLYGPNNKELGDLPLSNNEHKQRSGLFNKPTNIDMTKNSYRKTGCGKYAITPISNDPINTASGIKSQK